MRLGGDVANIDVEELAVGLVLGQEEVEALTQVVEPARRQRSNLFVEHGLHDVQVVRVLVNIDRYRILARLALVIPNLQPDKSKTV